MKKFGIYRLSIGVETLQDNLYYLNRHTDKNKLVEIKKLLDANDFINYNFDLIYGWPKSTKEAFIEDLKKEHIFIIFTFNRLKMMNMRKSIMKLKNY